MKDHIREIMGLPYKTIYSYWQHYWDHCIEMLSDVDNVSFRIVGPRMLLSDLVDELEGHGLSNQDNISYFKTQIGCLDKKDKVFNELCHSAVACLLKRLDDKVNRDSCIILCRDILNTLVVKRYFSLLVDWLARTIDETYVSEYDSRKRINEVTHLVIAEYVSEGFVLDEIRKYNANIPGVAIVEGGDVVAAPDEFDGLKMSDYSSIEEYYTAVGECIKYRDIYKCLNVLKYHYYEDARDAYFIVRLNGLKGVIDDYIGDINIYSPKKKKYVTGQLSFSEIETVSSNYDYVNAAIPIHFISIERAKEYAKTRLEEVLDILMLTYRTKIPVTMATNIYAVVADGNEISMSVSNRGNDPMMASRDEMMRYLDSLDLADVNEDGFKFMSDKHKLMEVGQGALKRRLKNAAHWYSKAITADKDVDTLLYSWFAVEGLLKLDCNTQIELLDNVSNINSLKAIQKFVTSIICKRFFSNYLRAEYRFFLYRTNQNDNYFDISEDVIVKAGLNLTAGDHYRDADFFNAIPDMLDCINDDIIKDRLYELQVFYQDQNGLKNKAKQINEDLLMIYRLRNMIVHNAALSCVNIAFYAHVARYIAQQVIWYVIDKVDGDKTIDEIVLSAKLNYEVFLANFDAELKKLIN